MNKAQEKILTLYGDNIPKEIPSANNSFPSILHVSAVYKENEDSYKIIRVDVDSAPRSSEDFFALNLARARADAIVTSGKVVRDEAGLSHSIQGEYSSDLEELRKDYLGKTKPPYSLIFTRGSPDLSSTFFDGKTRPIIYTSTEGYNSLDKKVLEEKNILAKDGGESPTINEALKYLKNELDVNLVSMEAGPSVSNQLYDENLVSELMLSVYSGKINPDAIGKDFISPKTIDEKFNLEGKSKDFEGWNFRRYLKK